MRLRKSSGCSRAWSRPAPRPSLCCKSARDTTVPALESTDSSERSHLRSSKLSDTPRLDTIPREAMPPQPGSCAPPASGAIGSGAFFRNSHDLATRPTLASTRDLHRRGPTVHALPGAWSPVCGNLRSHCEATRRRFRSGHAGGRPERRANMVSCMRLFGGMPRRLGDIGGWLNLRLSSRAG